MSNRLAVGTRKGLFTVVRDARTWRVVDGHFLGDPVSLVGRDPRDGAWYAALDHGHFGVKLHRSDDDGGTWQEISAPSYPEKPGDSDDSVPWSLKLIWAFGFGGADEPGALWCGTIPGGLFRSTDRGATWQLNRALWDEPRRRNWFGGGADQPGIHSICVDPRRSARVVVGVSCGGVWVTEDRGETWEVRADGMRADFMPPDRAGDQTIQDPHLVVQCAAAPDHYWSQHHCGIWRSTDACASWQPITEAGPSMFGFAVAVHPGDSKTAWFVPAISDQKRIPVDGKVVVTRTRDGGKSFEVLRSGLPQEHAYDLTFRHALDIDSVGERLAFGSTTGSLWVSENQGDHWQAVSEHLPPVYCVRFV